jgi:monoamine oxidase
VTDVDVCVVGAGYAGLSAARTLSQAGKSVAVLEARDRVGGRAWTQEGPGGVALDMGGTWVGPGQDAILDLAKEFGVDTYPTFDEGATVFLNGTNVSRYRGTVPKMNPVAVAALGVAMLRLDTMAKKVPLDAPWTARKAKEWDQQSAATWIAARGRVPTKLGRELVRALVRGLFTCDPAEVSLLHVLYLIRSAGSLNALLSIKGGYQQDRLSGGAQRIANLMADALGNALTLNAPVRAIAQTGDGVTVIGDRGSITAAHAVVAAPPVLASAIDYAPALPIDRVLLMQRMPAGAVRKALAMYETSFWRADGCSGQSVAVGSPYEMTLDISPASGTPGILAAFAFGPCAVEVEMMSTEEQRRLVVDTLVDRFGPAAASPVALHELDWATEPWSRGGMMAHLGPGVLTQFGPLLRRPEGRIHWAGTETSTKSHGTIDGALRSGRRVADEILAR